MHCPKSHQRLWYSYDTTATLFGGTRLQTYNDKVNLRKRDSVLTVLSVKKKINLFNCLEDDIFRVGFSFYG